MSDQLRAGAAAIENTPAAGRATGGYECGRARFVPEAAAIIVREATELVRSLYA